MFTKLVTNVMNSRLNSVAHKPLITTKKGPTVPLGIIAVNDKWHDTPVGKELKRVKAAYFIDGKDFGVVDFFITQTIPVVYILQSELIFNIDYSKTKIRKLIDDYPTGAIVIAERNISTITFFNELVEFATINLELDIIPIGNQLELPQLLRGLALVESTSPSNPFKQKSKPDLAALQLKMFHLIPGVGDKKFRLLFEKFGHIEGIAYASQGDLSAVVGDATAKNVWNFFHEKIRIPV